MSSWGMVYLKMLPMNGCWHCHLYQGISYDLMEKNFCQGRFLSPSSGVDVLSVVFAVVCTSPNHRGGAFLPGADKTVCIYLCIMNTALITSTSNDRDRESLWKIRHQLHIDVADHGGRLHCVLSLWTLKVIYFLHIVFGICIHKICPSYYICTEQLGYLCQ
jgi:hypothetical protein